MRRGHRSSGPASGTRARDVERLVLASWSRRPEHPAALPAMPMYGQDGDQGPSSRSVCRTGDGVSVVAAIQDRASPACRRRSQDYGNLPASNTRHMAAAADQALACMPPWSAPARRPIGVGPTHAKPPRTPPYCGSARVGSNSELTELFVDPLRSAAHGGRTFDATHRLRPRGGIAITIASIGEDAMCATAPPDSTPCVT